MHYTICLKLISSSAQVALPPAFARLEQRGVSVRKCDILFQTLSTVSHATSPSPQFFSNLELAQITLVLFVSIALAMLF